MTRYSMRLWLMTSAACAWLLAAPASGQDWIQYTSRADFFTVNFPAEPTVQTISFPTEYGVTLPARVHAVTNGQTRYAVTVVDYGHIQQIHADRLKGCAEADINLCTNPYINELRGAMDYAAWGFLQRQAKITDYAYYNADRVEGRRVQLVNADGTRTFAAINMHENRLYIIEGTVPVNAPPPGLFQQSIGFVDASGVRIRYESIYANMYPAPPRVQYAPVVPDLSGLTMGSKRHFTEGPFAGQTWGVDGSGLPYLVQETTPTNAQGLP